MSTKIGELENLTQKHFDTIAELASSFKDNNPYKQEFVKHLLYDYLFDTNAVFRETPVQKIAEEFGGLRAYRQVLAFDLEHLDLLVKTTSRVFDNDSDSIMSYSYDPTETIDISQDYLDDFYNNYNEYIK